MMLVDGLIKRVSTRKQLYNRLWRKHNKEHRLRGSHSTTRGIHQRGRKGRKKTVLNQIKMRNNELNFFWSTLQLDFLRLPPPWDVVWLPFLCSSLHIRPPNENWMRKIKMQFSENEKKTLELNFIRFKLDKEQLLLSFLSTVKDRIKVFGRKINDFKPPDVCEI